jgi:chemosensory pili system protein ChpA (sensor histidine kinase/response regulator)
MQEEIDNLREAQAKWLADPERIESLTPIRRSFHTLKGSGRLVGASALGEYAWKVENMLNRVLDHSIPANANVQALVRHAIDALPQLRAALMGEGAPTAPLAAIMETADRLANGQEGASIEDIKPAATETVRRIVRRRVPRAQAAVDAIPSATLAHIEPAPEPEAAAPAHEVIAAPVLPPVDPVLLEILRSEVAQYLQTIRHAINRVGSELRVDDSLLRAVHTLHGAIAMVDIPLLTQLLSPLESLLKRLRAAGHPLSAEGVNLLGKSADAVDFIMGQFDAEQPQLPDLDALIQRLTELRDAQPEPQVAHVLFEPLADDLAIDGEADEGALGAALDAAMPAHPDELAAPRADEPKSEAPMDDFTAELMAALGDFESAQPAEEAGHEALLDAVASTPITAGTEDDFAALYGGIATDEPGHEAPAIAAEPANEYTLSFGDDGIEAVELAGIDAEDAAHVELSLDAVEPAEMHLVGAQALVEADGTPAADATATHAALEPVGIEPEIEEAEVGPVLEDEPVDPTSAFEPMADLAEPVSGLADEPAIEAPSLVDEVPALEAEPVAHDAHAPVEFVHAEPTHAVEADTPSDLPKVAEPADATAEYAGSWTNDQIDPDLLEIFTEEAREILDHSDGVLAQWRAEPTEPEHMASLQRDLHTLKGGARIAGMVPVGDLTHAIETLLESPVGHDPSRVGELIRALEAGFDTLHGLVQRVSQGRGVEYPQAMIDRFLAMAGNAAPAAEGETAAAPAARLPELLPEEGQFEDSRGPQEQIRVRSELLDTLVNHAGEVAIYRSRLEQQVAGYRFNLVELDQTVQRLRSQLRMLEIETEAQIIARFQREHREAGISVFDPLELDRYSQLQQYSRALAESVSDLVSIQSMLDELTRQAETLLIQQSRVSSELQDGLLRTRMLPFDTMVPNLRRTLRQAAQEQGKSAQLFVEGAHGEMDRTLLDRLKAPFEHMLRNAVAHGIETPDERRKAGKPAEGAVRIRVAREATEVVVRVTDDGRGLDRDAVRKRGIERGLLRPDAKPSDDQLLALITQPGFSTASSVTQLAGRGVGMDVVANEIKQLGGSIAVESQPGQGTTFVLRLPFTLAVTQAILVRIGESTFAIPMTSVQGVVRISPADLAARMAEYEPTFPYAGEQYGIHDLAELLGIPAGHAGEEQLPLLLTRAGDLRAAIRIDAVIGSREIVVKSVGPQVSSVPGILGATIMGDGSVLIILDLPPLVRHGIIRRQERLAEGLTAVEMPVIEEERVRPLVMVVDDSITMRKVTGRVLERHEYEVHTAKDGLDALEKLHERVPDLMLLDIEMPRMDGFELAEQMKADPRLRHVPIIMITSRTGDKHRQRAFDIGVDRYLGKPYQEAELLTQISEVLEQRALQDKATESAHG